jgi:protein involved in polysaccharide export with SLBB domain
MTVASFSALTQSGRARRRRALFSGFAVFACAALLFDTRASAQGSGDQNGGVSSSELAADNLDRVGASEGQITAVLNANPGLLVELKRWVAKDAADRGQIVEDSDLTDAAIFARLAQEQKFRAVATRLLQSYGYLVPKVNPDSEIGRQQAALTQERIRQMVAAEQAKAVATCDEKGSAKDANCQKQGGVTTGRKAPANPSAAQPDRSLDDLLTNPTIVSPPGNAQRPNLPVLRTSADSSLAAGGASLELAGLQQTASSLSLVANDPPGDPPADPPRPPLSEAERSPKNVEVTAADGADPPMARHWSPYSDIPSVYDMFAHDGAPAAPVERFGESVFRNAPDVAGTIPIDFPASPDYVVGPGDGLTIDLWGGVSQRLVRTVDREGRVSLPEVGPLEVNGRSLAEVQQAVQGVLRTQFRDVSADVSLSRLRTVRVYVVGDVDRPGPYDVSSLSTPLNALLAAGGPNANGSLRVVDHYRSDTLVQRVDLYDLLLHGVRTDIKRLEPGDTLLVPPIGAEIRIDGMVRRPAIYELHGETTLKQALDLAGGILPAAALSHIEVQRLEAHDKVTMLSLDISGTTDPAAIEEKLASFQVHDQDEIHIFPIAKFNQDAVYLQGHVLRAGKYAYKPGMKLTDVISSFGDLLPEPATTYAEIIRLNPPDYHPNVESFDLAAALANPNAAPALQPLDTIRIFSRFDFESAPTVSVTGAVRRPGTFQTAGQIHLRDALELSGGLTPDASSDSAQIIRLMPDSSLKIISVQLKEALAGDAAFNVLLEPRDRILIHENILRTDPPAVLIGGEVTNPGRYALTQDLRVSDLIQLAGGLKRSAETDSADLTLYATSNEAALVATHVNVNLAAAMKGDAGADVVLHDGDVLTIRQVPGWNDLQAEIRVQGEVVHPGTYGIRPGERLSSVLERAGGFAPDGYPYGAILQRAQVRELETQEHDAMILRVKDAQNGLELLPDTDPQQKAAKEIAIQQWQSSLDELNSNPPIGRVAIRISPDIKRWKNTAADVEVRSGDVLIIPKRPGYVLVSGQVFNPTAVSFRPGRSAEWYVSQSGGPTPLANKKAIFVIRADGSVLGGKQGLWTGDSLRAELQPGDTVVVPEKALAGNVKWQNLWLSAQVASSIASTVFIALRY